MRWLGVRLSILGIALTGACVPAATDPPAASAGAEQNILARSNPTAGATVDGSLSKLELWFDPGARLGEVTVTGPEGVMPMMVTAVGEVGYYSLPISAAAPGAYTVAWRASRGGREYQGSFGFTLR